MKTKANILIGFLIVFLISIVISCSASKDTYQGVTDDVTSILKPEKQGVLLWGEACNRCHLAPSPADFNDTDWETIGLHMRVRANFTETDITKIIEFLKSAN